MFVEALDLNAKRVLATMLSKGIASGRQLKAVTRLEPAELLAALRTLVRQQMIATDSYLLTEEEALESFYNIRPSARQMAEYQLRFGA